ncbi:MAG: YqjF family protein [Ilumatobacter sp.]
MAKHRTGPTPISATRPAPMGRWWLRNRWDELAFVHHAYPPDAVQALLPDELEVDTFDGKAWVSLVPFQMSDATPRFLPPIPWISSFAETNVRTYVIDRAGNRAVWFFSLEASRLAIVAFARLFLGFPYVWTTMSIERAPSSRSFVSSTRRWPALPRSATSLTVEIGDVIEEPSDLDVFLTARWGTVARWPARRGHLRHHPVDHPEWTLRAATLSQYSDSSLEAAGLPAPTDDPIVRYVDTIEARFGRPDRV